MLAIPQRVEEAVLKYNFIPYALLTPAAHDRDQVRWP